jgi:hypothetical protein
MTKRARVKAEAPGEDETQAEAAKTAWPSALLQTKAVAGREGATRKLVAGRPDDRKYWRNQRTLCAS